MGQKLSDSLFRFATFSIFLVDFCSFEPAQAQNSPVDELYLKLKQAPTQDKTLTDQAQIDTLQVQRMDRLNQMNQQNKKTPSKPAQSNDKMPEPSLAPNVERTTTPPPVSQKPLPPTLIFPGDPSQKPKRP